MHPKRRKLSAPWMLDTSNIQGAFFMAKYLNSALHNSLAPWWIDKKTSTEKGKALFVPNGCWEREDIAWMNLFLRF